MTSDSKPTQAEINIFFDAACCVCAADGRLCSREVAGVLEALRALGVRTADNELQKAIQARAQRIHKQGVVITAATVCQAIRETGSIRLAGVLQRTLPSLVQAGGVPSEDKNRVATRLLEACSAPRPPKPAPALPATAASSKGKSRTTLSLIGVCIGGLAFVLLFGAVVIAARALRDSLRAENGQQQAAILEPQRADASKPAETTPRPFRLVTRTVTDSSLETDMDATLRAAADNPVTVFRDGKMVLPEKKKLVLRERQVTELDEPELGMPSDPEAFGDVYSLGSHVAGILRSMAMRVAQKEVGDSDAQKCADKLISMATWVLALPEKDRVKLREFARPAAQRFRDGIAAARAEQPALSAYAKHFDSMQVALEAMAANPGERISASLSLPSRPVVTDLPAISNSLGMEFRLLPSGTFMMGSNEGDADEKPVHEVRLTRPFYIGVGKVTESQWAAVMQKTQSNSVGPERMSRHDVAEFLKRLAELPAEKAAERVYRLPTEAEWEYACRAGSTTEYSFGNEPRWAVLYVKPDWCEDAATHLVRPNPWGLRSMHDDTLHEWVADFYGPYPDQPVTDPVTKSGARIVLRGGRSADRTSGEQSWNSVSLRLVLEPPSAGVNAAGRAQQLAQSGKPEDAERSFQEAKSAGVSRAALRPAAIAITEAWLTLAAKSLSRNDGASARKACASSRAACQSAALVGYSEQALAPLRARGLALDALALEALGEPNSAETMLSAIQLDASIAGDFLANASRARLRQAVISRWTDDVDRAVAASDWNAAFALVGKADWLDQTIVEKLPPLRNSVGIQLKLIPHGTFTMGDGFGAEDETPHEVTLSAPYYIGVFEVTNAQWNRVMGQPPKHAKQAEAENVPKTVSRDEAILFCQKLSAMPEERCAGRTYRLPTEAEWERACRAGTTSRWSFGNDESKLDDYAWFFDNCVQDRESVQNGLPPELAEIRRRFSGKPHPVGLKLPNAWGLHDMHGNVDEWVDDWYGEYSPGAATDPHVSGDQNGRNAIGRGGNCRDDAESCRTAKRKRGDNHPQFGAAATTGFRIAMSPSGVLQSCGVEADERLQQRVTVELDRTSLSDASKLLELELGLPIELLVEDLREVGVSSSQIVYPAPFVERNKPAAEILRKMLASFNKDLVYVLRKEGGLGKVVITTRAASEKRGEPPAPDYVPFDGNGLRGMYYTNGRRIGGPPALERLDPTIDFPFNESTVPKELLTGSLAVQWTGTLIPKTGGQHRFFVRGNRTTLWIDDKQVLDTRDDNVKIGSAWLGAGRRHAIRIEYVPAGDELGCSLSWAGEDGRVVPVPADVLSPTSK
jgi:formylglycine-generating enzyme required for sulfatase activity